MKRQVRSSFSFLLIVASLALPHRAWCQRPAADDALRRIGLLEERVAQLEQRIRQLEAQLQRQEPQTQLNPGAAKWKVIANWRRLRKGMTMSDVTALLGEPEKVNSSPYSVWWYWGYPGGGSVNFDARSNTVDGWSEPSG